VQVRDSAGITIVENPDVLPPFGGGWAVAAEPAVVIGTAGNDADQVLYGVSGASRLSNGRIAIGDGGSQEIRFYDPEGKGRTGMGGLSGCRICRDFFWTKD
jgi:hypothetical protein